jgi:hypothetical protein
VQLLSFDGTQRIDWRDDRDVLEGVEVEQILVTGDNQIDLGGERQGEDVVIVGIAADRGWQGCWGGDLGEGGRSGAGH